MFLLIGKLLEESHLYATLSAFYVLPKIAIFPIMMLVFPDPFGEGPKLAVVAISVFFLVTINTMVGVRDIDPVLLEAAYNYGARRAGQLFRHVVIPGAMAVIFSGLVVVMLLGVLLTAGLKWIERAVMPWRKDVRQGRS